MGTITNCVPFLNHNPAPRITYSCSMQKQSVGLYTSSFQHRTDTLAHMLFYPQKPLVRSDYAEILNCTEQPAGQIAIVAIACYGG
jgi:DNA-directed RNA polymerase II subunit RPB2